MNKQPHSCQMFHCFLKHLPERKEAKETCKKGNTAEEMKVYKNLGGYREI